VSKKQRKALKAISNVFENVQLKAPSRVLGPHPTLVRAVDTADTVGYVGWINHAGRVADGTYQVQFDVPGDGWSSRWPKWAYAAAREALVSRKRVWVIANGEPFGANLLQVLVLNQDV